MGLTADEKDQAMELAFDEQNHFVLSEPNDCSFEQPYNGQDGSYYDAPYVPAPVAKKVAKKRKAKPDSDDWLAGEEKPLEKPKKKRGRPSTKTKKENIGGTLGPDHRLFYFPQDKSLRKPEKRFQCTLCVRGFQDKRTFDQHPRRHGAKSERDCYFCTFCTGYMAFETNQELLDHVKAIHEFDKISCPHCELVFDKCHLRKLTLHIETVHNPEGKKRVKPKIQCAGCGAELTDKKAFALHITTKGKFHDAKCRICDNFEAKTWGENKAHFDQYHEGQVQVQCGFCIAFFRNKTERINHLEKCPEALKSRQKSGKSQRQVCPYCAKEISQGYLQFHINQYHGSHSIPCKEPGCDYIIKHPDAVKIHMELHTKYTCEECGWSGRWKHLVRHKKNKHMDPSKRAWMCEICKKGFVDSNNLRDHMNTHTGEKPHKCPVCNQGFASNGTMKGHLKAVHQGIKRKGGNNLI